MPEPTISISFTYEELNALILVEESYLVLLPGWKSESDPVLPDEDEETNAAQRSASDKVRASFAKLYNQRGR